MNNSANIFWKTVSIMFHPLMVPLYFVLFYYLYTMDVILPGEITLAVTGIAISTLIIPILIIMVMKWSGRVESMSLKDPQERRLPILVVCILLGVAMYKMSPYVSLELMVPIMGMEIAMGVLYISLWWTKISIHSMAWAAMIIAVSMLLCRWGYGLGEVWILLVVLVLIYDIVVMARMEQGCHTWRQILAGTMVGVAAQSISFLIWG